MKFKVLDGTEPTLSMTMLVANGNQLVFRGESARLMPSTSIENDWNLKMLINNSNEVTRIDLWTRISTKLGSEFEPVFFLVSEDDSILLRHMDDAVDTSPDKCATQIHRINGQPEEPAHRERKYDGPEQTSARSREAEQSKA